MLAAVLATMTILTAPAAAAGVVTASAGPMQITALATGWMNPGRWPCCPTAGVW